MKLETDAHIMRYAKLSFLAIALLGGSAVALGGFVPLEGAVVTSGTIVIDGNVKKVQHQTGGTIGALFVKEGSPVKEGDIVARLDDTQVRANLGIIIAEHLAQRARVARATAERDDVAVVTFPAEIVAQSHSDPETKKALLSELANFQSRRSAREGQKDQLRKRIAQAENEIDGMNKQKKATEDQMKIAQRERAGLEPLIKERLVQTTRISQLDREVSQKEGIIGDAVSRVLQAKERIAETNVQIAQIDRERTAEATKELRESEGKIAELVERRRAAEDQLSRVDIKATASGVVHEMTVHTVGGVINPGESMMLIVPEADSLVIEARVPPQDIDQVHLDQSARVRFTSFNQRLTPEFTAKVARISPNTSRDQQTGQTFYTVGVRLVEGQMDKLRGSRLVPGMMADTFITTEPRTVLSFLMKPIMDNFNRVFAGR